MKRVGMVLVAAALLAPNAAQAQKRPSNNMHTRSADVYLNQAAQARVATDRRELFEKALNAALEGMRQDPDNPRSWFQAGVAYVGLEDFQGADTTLARAERLYPEYAAETEPMRLNAWIASYNRGVQALQQGDYGNAIAALELADRLYGRRPEALVTLGSLYVEQGELAKAEQSYQKALTILRGPERDRLQPEQVNNWQEDELSVSLRLAHILAEQDRASDAEKVLRDLIAAQPQNTLARSNLAGLLLRGGRNDDAAAIYRELLQDAELAETTLFNIGIGLFRAQNFAESAVAFRRATEINPLSHEGLYNLAQALLGRAGELDDEKASAAAPRKEQIDAELGRASEEMLAVTERLHAIDPTNRNVLMLMAQAQRTIGELKGGTAAEEWNRKVLATLERHKALPFEVIDIVARPERDVLEVSGRITNLTRPQNSPIRFRFSVVGVDGTELASEEVTVTAPATEESTRFTLRLTAPEGAAGWKYRVID
jgi:tetratricopeptide (TPR) repeat protein